MQTYTNQVIYIMSGTEKWSYFIFEYKKTPIALLAIGAFGDSPFSVVNDSGFH